MKIQIKKFSNERDYAELMDNLLGESKQVKVAEWKKSKVEYYFDPKQSTIYGYLNGKTNTPVIEFPVKDADYLKGIIEHLESIPGVKIVL